jgi:hypothetical protein
VFGFYKVSCDADQGKIWYPQSEGISGGERIFSLSLLVTSMVSQYFLFWSKCHSQVYVQHLVE